MRAYSTASGGVIFVPDQLEKKTKKAAISYGDLAKGDKQKTASKPFLWAWIKRKKAATKKAA